MIPLGHGFNDENNGGRAVHIDFWNGGWKIDEVFILIVTRLTTNLLHVFVFEKQNVFVISVSPPSQDMLGPRSPINYDQATEDMVSTRIMTQHKRKILTLD